MRQVHVEQVAQRGEEAVRRSARQLAERLHKDGAASAASQLCSGRGLLTAHVPFLGHDPHPARGPGEREGRKFCHCFPGWFGERCDVGPGHPAAPPTKQQCVLGCGGRGVCKLNWCPPAVTLSPCHPDPLLRPSP